MSIDSPGVVEQAVLSIVDGRQEAFEEALVRGFEVLRRSSGFRWARALRQVEEPTTYVLLVGWDTVESHTERFVGSELYEQWRTEIGPFLAGRAAVAHYVDGPRVPADAR